MSMKYTHSNTQSGYILFFAMIVSSIVLSLLLAISLVAFRQSIFTREVRESTKAFYAADMALDCLTPLDNRGDFGIDSTSVLSTGPFTACDGITVIQPRVEQPPTPPTTLFSYGSDGDLFNTLLLVGSGICARAEVTKFIPRNDIPPTNPGGVVYETNITTWGYNVSCADYHQHIYTTLILGTPSSVQGRLVERSLNYTYFVEE